MAAINVHETNVMYSYKIYIGNNYLRKPKHFRIHQNWQSCPAPGVSIIHCHSVGPRTYAFSVNISAPENRIPSESWLALILLAFHKTLKTRMLAQTFGAKGGPGPFLWLFRLLTGREWIFNPSMCHKPCSDNAHPWLWLFVLFHSADLHPFFFHLISLPGFQVLWEPSVEAACLGGL